MNVPAVVLHALRDAVLAGPEGEQRLRDAGFVTGLALHDAFGAEVERVHGVTAAALPMARFAEALGAYLAALGWGTPRLVADASGDVLRIAAARWIESDAEAQRPYPSCHFSTGLFAGLLGRAAGAPLAVLEICCRAAGAPTCTFAVGSREVMDAMWERMQQSEGGDRS